MTTMSPVPEALADRHADFYLRLVREGTPHLTSFLGGSLGDEEHGVWIRRFEAEQHNLRAAAEHLIATEHYEEAGIVCRMMAEVAAGGGRSGESKRWIMLALEHEDRLDVRQREELHLTLGEIYFIRGEFDAAAAEEELCLEIGRSLGDARIIGRVQISVAWRLWYHGRHREAFEAASAAAEALRVVEDDALTGAAYDTLSWTQIGVGDAAGSLESTERAVEIYKRHPWQLSMRIGAISNAYMRVGQPERARELAEWLLEESRRTSRNDWILAQLLEVAHAITTTNGDVERLAEVTEEALALERALGEVPSARLRESLGVVRERQGDYQAAEALYEEALYLAIASVRDSDFLGAGTQAWLHQRLYSLCLLNGDAEKARAHLESLLEIRQQFSQPGAAGSALQSIAGLHTFLGQTDEAIAALERANELDVWGDEDAVPIERARVNAKIARARGDHAEAASQFEHALALAEAAGNTGPTVLAFLLSEIARERLAVGDIDAASNAMERALEVHPDPAGTTAGIWLSERVKVAVARGRFEEAATALSHAIPRLPFGANSMVDLAVAGSEIAAADGRARDAGVLLGAARAYITKVGAPRTDVGAAIESLSETDGFADGLAEGEAVTIQHALTHNALHA